MENHRSRLNGWGWLWRVLCVTVCLGICMGGEAQARNMVNLCVSSDLQNNGCLSCGKIQPSGGQYSTIPSKYSNLQDAINAAVGDAALYSNDHTITIVKPGVYANLSNEKLYSGVGFTVPFPNQNANTARKCQLIIQGRSNLERESVVLHNPTGGVPRSYAVPNSNGGTPGTLAVPAVIGAEFSVIGTGGYVGMPLYLKHLTVAGSNLLANPSFEAATAGGPVNLFGQYHTYNGVSNAIASGWRGEGNIIGSQWIGNPALGASAVKNVLAGPESFQGAATPVYPRAQGFRNSSGPGDCISTRVALRAGQTYTFTAWVKKLSGSGHIRVALSNYDFSSLTSSVFYTFTDPAVMDAPTYVRIRYTFGAASGSNPGLKIQFYATTSDTRVAVDEVSVDAPMITGVFFKGPAYENWVDNPSGPSNTVLTSNMQGVEDCVVRNIGYTVGKLDNPDPEDCNSLNPDISCTETDDDNGHGIYIAGGSNALILDNDVRCNYDGVGIWDYSRNRHRVIANPRLWASGRASYFALPSAGPYNDAQRIRLNDRFGVGVRFGATPYIGKYWKADPGYPSYANPNGATHARGYSLNDFQANGFAAVGTQDDSAPWIYNNWIGGTFDKSLVNGFNGQVPHQGTYGILAKDCSAPVIWRNTIAEFNRAGIACKDSSTPFVGVPFILPTSGIQPCSAQTLTVPESTTLTTAWSSGNLDVNNINNCNLFANLSTNDYRYSTHLVYCGYGHFDNLDCAAVAGTAAARPMIQRSWINWNRWVGVGVRDWAAPEVYDNWIEYNQIGMSYMSVRDATQYIPKIGGHNKPANWQWSITDNTFKGSWLGNRIDGNQIGIALNNAGNRLNRVQILGNKIFNNQDQNLGVGIGMSDSFVHIAENMIWSNGWGVAPQTKAGIGVSNESDAVISSNNILDNIGAAIGVLDATADIHGNLMADNYPGKCAYGVYQATQPQVIAGSRDNYFFNGSFEAMGQNITITTNRVPLDWRKSGSLLDVQMYSRARYDGQYSLRVGNFVNNNIVSPSKDYVYATVMVGKNEQYNVTIHAMNGPQSGGYLNVTLYDPEYDIVYRRQKLLPSGYNINGPWLEYNFMFSENTDYADDQGTGGKQTHSPYLQVQVSVQSGDVLVDGFVMRKTYASRGSKIKVNHNIIVGDATCSQAGGNYQITGVEVQRGSRLLECKNNIIGRNRLGVNISAGGNGEAPGTADAGAVDYNLVYAWDHSANNNLNSTGYNLNGIALGEHTYQAGEVYSNNIANSITPYIPTSTYGSHSVIYSAYSVRGVTPFFSDPDHAYMSNAIPSDYVVRSSSLIYSYTNLAGYNPYLGLNASYKYPPSGMPYIWRDNMLTSNGPLYLFPVGSKDRQRPVLRSIWPSNLDQNASSMTTIVAFIEDQGQGAMGVEGGEGVLANSIMFTVKVGGVTQAGTTIIRPDYPPGSGQNISKAGRYKIVWHPTSNLGIGNPVKVYIQAKDKFGNNLITSSQFMTASDPTAPYVADSSFSTLTSNRADAPLEFSLNDDGTGVDLSTARMKVYCSADNEVYYDGPIYSDWNNPKYLATSSSVNYRRNRVSFRRPNNQRFPYGKDITLEIWASDFDGNALHNLWYFPIENDVYPPEEVGYFIAKAIGTNTVSLSWDESVDAPFRDPINGDLSHYELYYVEVCDGCNPHKWVLTNGNITSQPPDGMQVLLPNGEYRFRLRAVDINGNRSMGQFANRGALNPYGAPIKLVSGKVYDSFDGFSDDFKGGILDKWLVQGNANFSTDASGSGQLNVSGTDGELVGLNYQAANFICSAKVTLGAGGQAYLLLRKALDSDVGATGYAAFIDLAAQKIGFYKLPDASTVYAGKTNAALVPGTYLMEVQVYSNNLYLNVSGTASEYTAYTDSSNTYNMGQIAIWQPANSNGVGAAYDYIVVRDLRDKWSGNNSGCNGYTCGWESNWTTDGTKGGNYQLVPKTTSGKLVLNDYSAPTDFMLTADITFDSATGGGGLMFGDHNATINPNISNAYAVWLDAGANGIYLYSSTNGTNQMLANTAYTFATGVPYHVKLEVSNGGQMGVYICSSGVPPYNYQHVLGHASYNGYNMGKLGFWQKDKAGVRYDNFYFGQDPPYYQPYPETAGGNKNLVDASVSSHCSSNYVNWLIGNAQTGDTIVFSGTPPGGAWIFTTTVYLKDGVSMRGQGRGITIVRSSANPIIFAADGSTIEGFSLIGSNSTNTGIYAAAVNALIINNEITECYDGVRLGAGSVKSGSQSTIALNWIHDNGRLGIGVDYAAQPWITENKLWGNQLNGIGVRGSSIPYIAFNLIGSNGGLYSAITGNGNKGIATEENSQAYILHNEITLAAEHGIGARDNAKPKIEANNLHDNAHFGVGAYGSAQVEITGGNRLHNNGEAGIGCKDNVKLTINQNYIYSNDGSGIGGWDNSILRLSQNGIYHNAKQGVGIGGYSEVYSSTTQNFAGSIVAERNTIYSNYGGGFLGRRIQNAGVVNIRYNTIAGNTNWDGPAGIGIGGHRISDPPGTRTSGTIAITGNHISGNNVIFSNSLSYATYDISAGIGATDLAGANLTIVNNILDGNNSSSLSAVMGIGVTGKSNINSRSVVSNLIITSNSVVNHFNNNQISSAAAIGVKWVNIGQNNGGIYIRNNAPDPGNLNKHGLYNNQYGINLYQNGAEAGVANASITVSGNYLYSHKKNGISARYNEIPVTVQNNQLDNGSVLQNGNINTGGGFGMQLMATVACSNGSSCSSMSVYSNSIQNFGMSGMRVLRYSGGLAIRNNFISNCGLKYYTYPSYIYSHSGSDMGDGIICTGAKGCPAADGIQLMNNHISTDSMTGNRIQYNKFSGIGILNTDGIINAGNIIYSNGSLDTLPGFAGGGLCATCLSIGDVDPRGDAGVSIRALDGSKTLYIHETTIGSDIYDNHPGNVRMRPFTAGIVYHCDDKNSTCTPVETATGGPVQGFGKVFDCFNPVTAILPVSQGGCNGTYSGHTLINQDRFGILVRGPYSQNLVIEMNVIASNMLTSSSANKVCAGSVNESHDGGGIALTCGAQPIIRKNIIRNNGSQRESIGKGSHSGINILLSEWSDASVTQVSGAGNAQIYSNLIYGNANDGIDVRVYSSCWAAGPQIGVLSQTGNKIYNNGRIGVGIDGIWSSSDSAKIGVSNNNIYSNNDQGVGFYRFTGKAMVQSNKVYHNGVAPNEDGAGGISGRLLQPGAIITIYNNDIYSNHGMNGIGFKND